MRRPPLRISHVTLILSSIVAIIVDANCMTVDVFELPLPRIVSHVPVICARVSLTANKINVQQVGMNIESTENSLRISRIAR